MAAKTKKKEELSAPSASVRDGAKTSPVAILAIALAGGVGYFAWRLWTKRRSCDDADTTSGLQTTTPLPSGASAKSKSGGSSFTFDKQPRNTASTSGRQAAPSSSNAGQSRNHGRSNREPKPKTQKQLRKEAKQTKKAAREQAAKDAANAEVANAIAKRAREVGLGHQQPEPEKQYFVDYEGVTKAYDKIVEWQATGKKKF